MKYRLFEKEALGSTTRTEFNFFWQTVVCRWRALFRISECLLYSFVNQKNWSWYTTRVNFYASKFVCSPLQQHLEQEISDFYDQCRVPQICEFAKLDLNCNYKFGSSVRFCQYPLYQNKAPINLYF